MLALLITVLQLAWDYNKDVTVIEASIGQIEASFLQPISASLWNLDEEQVKVQIEGIMNPPNMQFVMVKEMLGNSEVRPLLTQGWSSPTRHLPRVHPELSGEVVNVYQLFVAASPGAGLPAPHREIRADPGQPDHQDPGRPVLHPDHHLARLSGDPSHQPHRQLCLPRNPESWIARGGADPEGRPLPRKWAAPPLTNRLTRHPGRHPSTRCAPG